MSERSHGKSPDEQGRIVREGYDNIAEEYTKDRAKFDNYQEIQEFIDHLPKRAVVLDIGCGGGVPVLKTLIDKGYDVAGIDFSSGMLEVAKKNVPQATLIHGDVSTARSEWEEIAEYYGVDMAWSHPAPDASLQMIKNAGFKILFDRLVTTGDETAYWILAKKN